MGTKGNLENSSFHFKRHSIIALLRNIGSFEFIRDLQNGIDFQMEIAH